MSWSTFSFRQCWAYAHDSQQDSFMALAAMYIEANPAYRTVPWLRDWQAFWLEAVGAQGNGCSDIGADGYLTDDQRVDVFRQFLRDYRSWLLAVGRAVDATTGMSVAALVAFTGTVDAVLMGQDAHPDVHREHPK